MSRYVTAEDWGIPIGQKMNKLLIVEYLGRRLYGGRQKPFVGVVCDCGTKKEVCWEAVSRGATKSCGCYNISMHIEINKTHGYSRVKGSKQRLYKRWSNIVQRCTNPNNDNYQYYGAKGIKICERWLKFENFLTDVGEPPEPHLTIDRIDYKKDYEPGNWRWATRAEQNRNKCNNRFVLIEGVRMTFSEASRKLGMGRASFSERMKKGQLNIQIVQ
jgi:hypothetical protein